MKCPIDSQLLAMSDKNGVEIDYCPTCRGVWLDRGELDKIIEKFEPGQQPKTFNDSDRGNNDRSVDRDRRHSYDNDSYNTPGRRPKKKRESFLGDLFEF